MTMMSEKLKADLAKLKAQLAIERGRIEGANAVIKTLEAKAVADKARIAGLESDISYLGDIGGTCTYHILKKACNGCKCHRA